MGFGPAVVEENGKMVLHHISSSQVNTFETCQHRWYEEKVSGAPSFSDWSWAQSGVAAHEILENQINEYIGVEQKKEPRVFDPVIQDEAEEMVSWFHWEDYFEGHQIIETEMDMILNLSDEETKLPIFVGSADVVSIDKDGIVTITDWKTGYGANKGVDIQAQSYTLAITQNMSIEEVMFRRIYPRLPGEERGTRRVEEYLMNIKDTGRYLERIKFLAGKMQSIVDGDIEPKVTPSDSCVHCPVAYRCPKAKQAAFSPKELAEKRKVLKAALAQVENALKKVADKGDFFVGDEHYGYKISEYYKSKEIKSADVPAILIDKNPELAKEKAKITIDEDVKKYLESEFEDAVFKNTIRKTFSFLNEKELKDAKKAAKNAESTTAETVA